MRSLLLFIYNIIWFISLPIVTLRMRSKSARKLQERVAKYTKKRPEGFLIWVHCASVGEMLSIKPVMQSLIDNFSKDNNTEIKFLVTSCTDGSAKIFEQRDFKSLNAIHQYAPLDHPIAVKRFQNHWKPDFAIFVDSELWPNMLASMRNRVVLINARISDKSYMKWLYLPLAARYCLECFVKIFPFSKDEVNKFKTLAPKADSEYLVNIKYCTGKNLQNIEVPQLSNAWVAASTHPGEEEIIMQAHKHLQKLHSKAGSNNSSTDHNTQHNNIRITTIIAPRHPQRRDEIIELAKQYNLSIALRSKSQPIDECDLYLLDTFGELENFFEKVNLVFIGGSLVNHGGHNILEPLRHQCTVITGPYMQNFDELFNTFKSANAVIEVQNAQELAQNIQNLYNIQNSEYTQRSTPILESQKAGFNQLIHQVSQIISTEFSKQK